MFEAFIPICYLIISVGELTIFDGETLKFYSIRPTFRWFQLRRQCHVMATWVCH